MVSNNRLAFSYLAVGGWSWAGVAVHLDGCVHVHPVHLNPQPGPPFIYITDQNPSSTKPGMQTLHKMMPSS